MTFALQATALGKRYSREGWALRDCNLAIPGGRIVALVGPNGAGKTTLMHLAVGLLQPTAGDIQVFGWSPRDTPLATLARVGFLAQDRPLFASLTVEETLGFGRRLNPRWDDKLARRRVSELGVPLKARVGKLSGGQRAQVALTVAIAKRPDLLLLDEPLANLDPVARHEVSRGLMTSAADQGLTVIYSSHVVSELEQLCDYVVMINRGRVQLAGPLDELIEDHIVLTVPVDEAGPLNSLSSVICVKSGPRVATVIARNGRAHAFPGHWHRHGITLEDLVVAYMTNPDASALPVPALEEA